MAHVPDNTFQWLMRQFEERMIVLSDMAFQAAEGDPSNLKLCPRGEWEDRLLVKTVLARKRNKKVSVHPCPEHL